MVPSDVAVAAAPPRAGSQLGRMTTDSSRRSRRLEEMAGLRWPVMLAAAGTFLCCCCCFVHYLHQKQVHRKNLVKDFEENGRIRAKKNKRSSSILSWVAHIRSSGPITFLHLRADNTVDRVTGKTGRVAEYGHKFDDLCDEDKPKPQEAFDAAFNLPPELKAYSLDAEDRPKPQEAAFDQPLPPELKAYSLDRKG